MSLPEGSHDTSEPTGKHLYLIFDDWYWGYSIRKLKLPLRPPLQRSLRPLEQRRFHRLEPRRPKHKRLPPPCIRLEAARCYPYFFGAVGTNIVAAPPRNNYGTSQVVERFLPIFDARSLAIRFGPELLDGGYPIFIPVGDDKLFALDMGSFSMLSISPLYPSEEWSWCDLPDPPLQSSDVTSFAVDSDGLTIFASTDCATFAFNIISSKWTQSSNCSLPFAGPANYIHALDIFVGLSKAPNTNGDLCFCRKLGGDENLRSSKENLSIKDPASHVDPASYVGATLVYLGGSVPGFCLVECIKSVNKLLLEECDQLEECVDEEGGNCGELDQLKKNVDEGDGVSGSMQECGELEKFVDKFVDEFVSRSSMHDRYLYRLTTFSLSFDNNGDLTTGETCVVQFYKVPKEVSEVISHIDPVAFCL